MTSFKKLQNFRVDCLQLSVQNYLVKFAFCTKKSFLNGHVRLGPILLKETKKGKKRKNKEKGANEMKASSKVSHVEYFSWSFHSCNYIRTLLVDRAIFFSCVTCVFN